VNAASVCAVLAEKHVRRSLVCVRVSADVCWCVCAVHFVCECVLASVCVRRVLVCVRGPIAASVCLLLVLVPVCGCVSVRSLVCVHVSEDHVKIYKCMCTSVGCGIFCELNGIILTFLHH